MRLIIASILTFFSFVFSFAQSSFVQVEGTKFVLDGKPYRYMGANFWQAMNLASKGPGGDRAKLVRELDRLKNMGVTNLRITAGSEGPNNEPYRIVPAMQTAPGVYDQQLLDGLDFVLAEMQKRNIKAVMCLNNMWPWTGGMAQYLIWAGEADSIPYPPPHPGGTWGGYQKFTAKFYSSKKAKKLFEKHVKFILGRTNEYTKVKYTEDPTIMSWELGNEPRAVNNYNSYYDWLKNTSELIKKLSPKHLVTIGSEGHTSDPVGSGNNFKKDHALGSIDYCCTHIWIQNFNWYDPLKPEKTFYASIKKAIKYLDKHIEEASEIGKPLVLEEFGCARDSGSYDPNALVTFRNQYFHLMFDKVYKDNKVLQGVNFWAWAGETQPKVPFGSMWTEGDPIIGDPPHEHQGWYSVYSTDTSTIAIIKEYAYKLALEVEDRTGE